MIEPFSNIPCIRSGFCNAAESSLIQNPILMNQVHSASVNILTATPSNPPECDALVTQYSGLKLTVKTADCAPILFVDPQSKIIAATHAGWKGAFQGIIETTVLTMLKLGATLNNIYVAIGPHLTQKSFQVSQDMASLFPKTEQNFFKETPEGLYFDFTAYLQHRLNQINLTHLSIYPVDTFSDSSYNSYRRDKSNPNRQYSFIELV